MYLMYTFYYRYCLNNRYILLNFPEDDVLFSYFPPFLVTNRRLRMYVGFPPFTKYEQ